MTYYDLKHLVGVYSFFYGEAYRCFTHKYTTLLRQGITGLFIRLSIVLTSSVEIYVQSCHLPDSISALRVGYLIAS